MTKRIARQGLMAQVLGRMSASETLISDRHSESMLVGLLAEAERVEDGEQASATVRRELADSWGFDDGPEDPTRKPFLYRDGVAVIPVHGILVNRFPYCWGFVTGYDFIRKQMNAALADPDVKMIVYDHDTPGGEAAGCDELAREIHASREVKPSLAVVNTLSASGGFWLAAPCSRVVCAPSGSVGSIGVYILHMNIQKMLDEMGVEVDYVQRGKFKTSGSPYKSMSREDRDYLQSMVDERYDEFVAAVAEFRGIEETVARDTEARVMRPTEAIALGLIDAAESPAQAVGNFLAELGTQTDPAPNELEDEAMADEITSEQQAAQVAEARKAEQARIKGITTHAEATGREGLAQHLAYDTDMTVEAAAAILAASPKAEAEKPEEKPEDKPEEKPEEKPEGEQGRSQFENAMDDGNHPNVSAPGGTGQQSKVDQILANQAAVTGKKVKA